MPRSPNLLRMAVAAALLRQGEPQAQIAEALSIKRQTFQNNLRFWRRGPHADWFPPARQRKET